MFLKNKEQYITNGSMTDKHKYINSYNNYKCIKYFKKYKNITLDRSRNAYLYCSLKTCLNSKKK